MREIVYEPVPPDHWPTETWETSTPEAQGMQSGKLMAMVADYEKRRAKKGAIHIDSLTIIRNGKIVSELYFNPLFPRDTPHVIHSCTKTIMGMLIGIAIEQGFIKNVEVPVLELLEAQANANQDPRIKALTLRDLLTMQTGLHSRDSYLYRWEGLFAMEATDNWTEYILNLPFEVDPGTRFDYSNMASFLLSAVITKCTGMDTLSFAQQSLFDPLGISGVRWEKSPEGTYMGFARMWMKPHDMAKIGLLLLQKGKWENRQILSRQWIADSIKAHGFPKKYRYLYDASGKKDYKISGANWVSTNLLRPFADGYGYQIWLDKSGMFSAVGVGGQFIMVAPKENLIMVATSKLQGLDSLLPAKLLKDFVLPSIVSNEAIAADEAAQQQLATFSQPPLLDTQGKTVPKLPEIADKISGKTYSFPHTLATNPWMYDQFKLVFTPEQEYAVFSYTFKQGEKVSYKIGLNQIYQRTSANYGEYAAKGEWTTADTFFIEYELVGYSVKGKWKLTFTGDEIEVEEYGPTGMYQYSGKQEG